MKKALWTGFKVFFCVAIFLFIAHFVIVEILAKLWEPLILAITGRPDLVIPLTLLFTAVASAILGFFYSNQKCQNFFKRYLRRIPITGWIMGKEGVPESIKDKPGCLVEFAPGETYFIAALIKEIKFKRNSGKTTELYVLYSPSAPVPVSGFPIIFAKKERVILLKISFLKVYQITASFGDDSPDLLEELAPFVSTD